MRIDDEQVLRGAEAAFARHGWQGATLERIAEAAGTTRVTLHRRGITKEALLAALVEEGTDAYRLAMMAPLTAQGSGRDRLELALRTLCEHSERRMPLLLAVRSQSDAIFHDDADEAALTRSPFTEPLERLLRDGIADGSLARSEPAETATVLFNLVGWTYIHLRTGHRWPPQRAADAVVGIALDGVAARTQPPT